MNEQASEPKSFKLTIEMWISCSEFHPISSTLDSSKSVSSRGSFLFWPMPQPHLKDTFLPVCHQAASAEHCTQLWRKAQKIKWSTYCKCVHWAYTKPCRIAQKEGGLIWSVGSWDVGCMCLWEENRGTTGNEAEDENGGGWLVPSRGIWTSLCRQWGTIAGSSVGK